MIDGGLVSRAMKTPLMTICVAGAIVLTGCPKSSLTLDKDGKRLAPALGETVTEIRFINRALFAVVPEGEDTVEDKEAGFVALSSTELIFGKGRPMSSAHEDLLRIPIQDIEGMAQGGPVLQFKYEGKFFMALPYRWFSDTADLDSLNELVNQLTVDSVTEVAFTPIKGFGRTINLAGIRSGFGRDYYDDYNPDLYDNGGSPRNDYQLPEYPEPLFPVQFNSDLNGTPPPYPPGQYPTTGQ
jgi:hypothetical protein